MSTASAMSAGETVTTASWISCSSARARRARCWHEGWRRRPDGRCPSFEQVQRLGAAHFADDDAIGA